MKRYIKDGEIITQGTPVIIGDMRVYNPTEEQYLTSGWVEYTILTPPPYTKTNDDIRHEREAAYRYESDSLYMAYVKYSELGNISAAEKSKTAWLNKIDEIDKRLPYEK
ncbi:MAG: hypothetical protein RR293_08660 [Bacteroidales bacterium]